MAISYGMPDNRSVHFERPFLKCDYKYVEVKPKNPKDRSGSHYIYILVK